MTGGRPQKLKSDETDFMHLLSNVSLLAKKNHVVTISFDRCSTVHLLLLHVARLSVPPATPPHVHVAPGHPSPEEHVENFFCRHITLEE